MSVYSDHLAELMAWVVNMDHPGWCTVFNGPPELPPMQVQYTLLRLMYVPLHPTISNLLPIQVTVVNHAWPMVTCPDSRLSLLPLAALLQSPVHYIFPRVDGWHSPRLIVRLTRSTSNFGWHHSECTYKCSGMICFLLHNNLLFQIRMP